MKTLDSIVKKIKPKKTKKTSKTEKASQAPKSQKSSKLKFFPRKRLWLVSGAVLTLAVIFFIFCAINYFISANKIYPNIYIGGINFANKTKAEAEAILNQKTNNYLSNASLKIKAPKEDFNISPFEIGASFDVPKTAAKLYEIGHGTNFFAAGAIRIRLLFKPINQVASLDFSEAEFQAFYNNLADKTETPFKNATLKIENNQIVVVQPKSGKEIEKSNLVVRLNNRIGQFQSGEFNLPLKTSSPQLQTADTEKARQEAEDILSDILKIEYRDKTYTVDKNQLISWVVFKEIGSSQVLGAKTDSTQSEEASSKTVILSAQLNQDRVFNYIENIANQVETRAENAKLHFSNGKLTVIAPSKTGFMIERDKLMVDLNAAAKSKIYRKVTIKMKVKIPDVREDNLKSLGIKELISEGISSYGGSPRNRIFNIQVGAGKFDGILIKPGGVFSFNQTLGPVDGEHGFLPELVIKINKTVPEFGGGLCQVSTTAFRAALLAGLPILERKAHAYRVRYYDWPYGPGVDATIYPPHPDLAFKNDTGNWILIQTSASGGKLVFDFYGTKSSRTAEITKPKILWARSDGSMGTVFDRLVYEKGKLIRTDTFKSLFRSPALFPHPATKTNPPANTSTTETEKPTKP